MSARVMQVIQTETMRGKGIAPDDPCRTVIQYYTFDGELLAERDEWKEEQELVDWKVGVNLCCFCGRNVEPLQAQITEHNSSEQTRYYHYACWQYKSRQEYKATQTQGDPEQ